MTPDEFRTRFNDIRAGFIGWARSGDFIVVSCEVYDTEAHEGAWLAAAAGDRKAAAGLLKSFGVHGFKFKKPPSRYTPEPLISQAIENAGSVVAELPDGDLVVFN